MLKRYKIQAKADGGYLREAGDGDIYLVSDVEREMVPRPNREAIISLYAEMVQQAETGQMKKGDYEYYLKALLRLVGLEV